MKTTKTTITTMTTKTEKCEKKERRLVIFAESHRFITVADRETARI